jgi:hypothetical protein
VGLKVYGEALEDHRPALAMIWPCAAMPTCRWRRCGRSRKGWPEPSYLADEGCGLVAHIYGQILVAAESMTSALSYWADSPRH